LIRISALFRRSNSDTSGVYANTNFVININAYVFSHFKCRCQCVGYSILKDASIGAAAHLDFKVVTIDEGSSFISFHYFMLHCTPLNSSPIRFLPLYLKLW